MCDFSNKILFLQCADAEALMINCVYIFDEKKLVTTQTETRKRIEKFFSQKSIMLMSRSLTPAALLLFVVFSSAQTEV